MMQALSSLVRKLVNWWAGYSAIRSAGEIVSAYVSGRRFS